MLHLPVFNLITTNCYFCVKYSIFGVGEGEQRLISKTYLPRKLAIKFELTIFCRQPTI